MGILLVYDVTDEKSFNSASIFRFLHYTDFPCCRRFRISSQLSRPIFRQPYNMTWLLTHTGPQLMPDIDPSPLLDIRTWHSNIEQHASEGVNKILIGNKCDWNDKRAVTVQQGRELADEFGLRFLETSAKANEGVEEAFFTLARWVT